MSKPRMIQLGWILFGLSGVFYLTAGILAGDRLSIIGSVLWLLGVGLFVAVGD